MFKGKALERRSHRLANFDYSSPGAYFITICTFKRRVLFGTIRDDRIILSSIGRLVAEQWQRSETIRDELELDDFVIMPNHFHALLFLEHTEFNSPIVGAHCNAPLRRQPHSLGSIISGFKGAVTRRARKITNDQSKMIWQRDYFERIVRNEQELNILRRYIKQNPAKWGQDRYFR